MSKVYLVWSENTEVEEAPSLLSVCATQEIADRELADEKEMIAESEATYECYIEEQTLMTE